MDRGHRNLVGLSRPQKMTHIDNGRGPGWNQGETAISTFCRKFVFFFKKNTKNPLKV